MDVTISSSRLRNYLINKHGLDLTNRIELIETWVDLPTGFERIMSYNQFRKYLNMHGDMYHIKGDKINYLVQKRDWGWSGISNMGKHYTLPEIYEDAGVPVYLSMEPNELFEIFGNY